MSSKKHFWDRVVRIWARAIGHLMGHTDDDDPTIPVLTQREAKIVMMIISAFIFLTVITNLFIISGIIHHW